MIRWLSLGLLRAALAIAILAIPATGTASPPSGRASHCQHERRPGSHHAAEAAGCETSDQCHDCETPACHATSHCGVTTSGAVVSGGPPAVPSLGQLAPMGLVLPLSSIDKAPPTRPPLR